MDYPNFARREFLKALGAAGIVMSSPYVFAQMQVDILGVGANQFPIAIQPFVGASGCPQDIAKIIGDDLTRSGLFRIVSAGGEVAIDSQPPWSELDQAGAEADVIGDIKRLSDDRWEIDFRLFDVVKQQELDGAGYPCPTEDLRRTAHRIADRIFEKLTGQKGDFSSRIACVRQSGRSSYELIVCDSDGANPKIPFRSNNPIMSLSWSPNGRQIAYTSFETGKSTVWVQDLSTGARQQVAAFRGNNSAPAFSPSGGTLAVALSKDGPTKIYLVNIGSKAATKFTDGSSIDTEPCFSPDGHYIYFVSDRAGGPQIYRKAVGGGGAERVSFGSNYAVSPTVSSTNREIAYVVRGSGGFKLVQQDLSNGATMDLASYAANESPSYSPNGNMIVYASGGALTVVSADGSTRYRLSGLGGNLRDPAWGPSY